MRMRSSATPPAASCSAESCWWVVVAGWLKVTDITSSVQSVVAYELFSYEVARVVGTALPVVEIAVGVLLAVGLLTRASAAVGGLLMIVFIAGIASAWARGLSIDCGCFGTGGPVDPEDTRYLSEILRDLGLLALAAWAVIPVAEGWAIADINVGILFLFAVSSLEVYGVIMGGWASNSKYPFLASLRSAAQMISYEVSLGLIIVGVLISSGTLNLSGIVESQRGAYGLFNWYWLAHLPMLPLFFISTLAETNRPPFDLSEAEARPTS